MVSDPEEQPSEDGWSEFKDGKMVPVEAKRDRDVAPRAIAAVVALVAAVIFVVQNGNRVRTEFLFIDGTPRLWVVILVSMLLGALLGQAVGLAFRRRRKKAG